MSEQLLTLFKFGLLAVLYVFFLRVLWAVWAEIKSAAVPANAGAAPSASKAATAGTGFAAAAAAGAVATRPPAPAPMPAPAAEPPAVVPDALPEFGGYEPDLLPPAVPDTVPTPRGLLVVREPAETAGMRYQLETEITVGRAAGCGICIDDTFVSQLHARVFRASDGYYLEDLGSTNGTFHNTHRLPAQQPQPLELGDYVQFGSTVLEFA